MEAKKDQLLRDIENFYLPQKLVKAIYDNGQIPQISQESQVGIGFIDIADYTYLSKFLSPMENQALLNGLYTAFQLVLEKHGGYLNKIEGDSMMFQFDGVIDPKLRTMEPEEVRRHIVKELFYTCVEMQRVCVHFNNANEAFLLKDISDSGKKALHQAFDIIKTLRERSELKTSMNAFFQIRIRIGASLGDVTIGNFGPEGAKHWDVIGMPVIDAKRMESTSPIGGLRISEDYYKVLDSMGVANDYWQRFRREAGYLGSRYAQITKDEVFSFKRVVIAEKKGATYPTYSVQVNPALPETIGRQVESLLEQGQDGADRILTFFQYYRGNAYIIDHLEALFQRLHLRLRKTDILRILSPKKMTDLETVQGIKGPDLDRLIDQKFSLAKLFYMMGRYQDLLKSPRETVPVKEFQNYEQSMADKKHQIHADYRRHKSQLIQRAYFHEVVAPMVYHSLRAGIQEYQARQAETGLVEI